MLQLLLMAAFAAAPLMLYIPPIRSLNSSLRSAKLLFAGAVSYTLSFCLNLRDVVSSFRRYDNVTSCGKWGYKHNVHGGIQFPFCNEIASSFGLGRSEFFKPKGVDGFIGPKIVYASDPK
ncbi:Unknown protein [Striga hermonthica]|uniref:Uncharacterized protein n=1 Tax=Striga hermonthica TaxID=68872 RepID=A0A9N7MKA4_STRHE|nr:Unknown protein [Striga hermonthica]